MNIELINRLNKIVEHYYPAENTIVRDLQEENIKFYVILQDNSLVFFEKKVFRIVPSILMSYDLLILNFMYINEDKKSFSNCISVISHLIVLQAKTFKIRRIKKRSSIQGNEFNLNHNWFGMVLGIILNHESNWLINKFIDYIENHINCATEGDCEFMFFIYLLLKKHLNESIEKKYLEKIGRFKQLAKIFEDQSNIDDVLNDYLEDRIKTSYDMNVTYKIEESNFLSGGPSAVIPLELIFFLMILEKKTGKTFEYNNDYLKRDIWSSVKFDVSVVDELSKGYEKLLKEAYVDCDVDYEGL